MITIIMSGGLGKRMNSDLPKVLHPINNKPMICYVIENAIQIGSSKILIVVGKYKNIIRTQIEQHFKNTSIFEYIDQPEPLGTGNAIQCCASYFIENKVPVDTNILILSGDVPLITRQTLVKLTAIQNSLLITKSDNPTGCGRIIFNDDNTIRKITEEKDCSASEKKIQYVNCGIYYISVDFLYKTVPFICNLNASSEYYLTDIVEIANNEQICMVYYDLPIQNKYQILNINTPDELLIANEIFSKKSS